MITTVLLLTAIIGLLIYLIVDNRKKRVQQTEWLAGYIAHNFAPAAPRVLDENETKFPEGYHMMRDIYLPTLSRLGTNPKINSESGIVEFTYEGLNFLLICPDNSVRFRLVLPGILSLGHDDENLPKAIEMINQVDCNWGVHGSWCVGRNTHKGEVEYRFDLISDQIITPVEKAPEERMDMCLKAIMAGMNDLRARASMLNAGDEDFKKPIEPTWNFGTNDLYSNDQMN